MLRSLCCTKVLLIHELLFTKELSSEIRRGLQLYHKEDTERPISTNATQNVAITPSELKDFHTFNNDANNSNKQEKLMYPNYTNPSVVSNDYQMARMWSHMLTPSQCGQDDIRKWHMSRSFHANRTSDMVVITIPTAVLQNTSLKIYKQPVKGKTPLLDCDLLRYILAERLSIPAGFIDVWVLNNQGIPLWYSLNFGNMLMKETDPTKVTKEMMSNRVIEKEPPKEILILDPNPKPNIKKFKKRPSESKTLPWLSDP